MHFEKSHLYHIFNQGNNHQRIFFREENYLFFVEKMRIYLLPYCDILAWCLLTNHFHWMVRVNQLELPASATATTSQGLTLSQALTCQPAPALACQPKTQTFNESIGIILRSYTRAINKQERYSGSLFRKATKAECLDSPAAWLTPSFYHTRQGTLIPIDRPEKRYPLVCFNYIHQNPVKAHLVKNAEDWQWSSYRDVVGLRNGTLINRELIKELELKPNP